MESENLSCSFYYKVTLRNRQEIWKNIASKVSACGVAVRTVPDIKDKWGLLKEASECRPPEYEETVVAILGNSTSLINGIAVNGTDSFVAGLDVTQPSGSGSEGVTEEIIQSSRPLTTESA
ncbi:uncharacterized protein LOC112561216 [Pomacea canaliculata]|uniref:uncharacterized protein LOC112561216 n=1 Tax=Pomacea canaliculata TaxID=400727 RepID=UPI000D72F6EA|nr:uncharacterized protein LOC112561216 [Pomacea canaliculata]